MSIIQLSRFKSNNAEEMKKIGKQAKALFEKHGAETLHGHIFHSGPFAGEWLITTRYASWEAYGKAQGALAKDPAWAKQLGHLSTVAELTARSLAVEVDL